MARPIKSLILALTNRCNLCCKYCYLAADEIGEEMAAEQVTRQGRKNRLAIQTNGTLLSRELVLLFKEYGFQVGISLDGPPDIQEKLRGRSDATLRGIQLLAKAELPFSVTTVVSRINIDHLDRLVLLLAAFPNCLGLGLDLLVNKGRASRNKIHAASSDEISHGMTKLVQALACEDKTRLPKLRLRELDQAKERGKQKKFCRAATGESLAVAPDGSLFPCGQTMRAQELGLGTIDFPQLDNQPLTRIVLTDPACKNCSITGHCPGDCPSRLYFNTEVSENPACIMHQTLALSIKNGLHNGMLLMASHLVWHTMFGTLILLLL